MSLLSALAWFSVSLSTPDVPTAQADSSISSTTYPWLDDPSNTAPSNHETLQQRFPPPSGFTRQPASPGSFAVWLRGLPLRPPQAKVHLFDGREKRWQGYHAAVLDIDCGTTDLQQCADAVIRLNAEYLYGTGQRDWIQYQFTSGDVCAWPDWRVGVRPIVVGNFVRFARIAAPDSSYASFRRYLNKVFSYAGTLSLARELPSVAPATLRPGDVFVQGGSPGHAVIVLDVAYNPDTDQTVFLLAQSYMPAQDIHVLKNPASSEFSPWYLVHQGPELVTPEWTFRWSDLHRFPTGD